MNKEQPEEKSASSRAQVSIEIIAACQASYASENAAGQPQPNQPPQNLGLQPGWGGKNQ